MAPGSLVVCLAAADAYTDGIGDLTGVNTLSASLDAVGVAFNACSTARVDVESDAVAISLGEAERADLLEPLIRLLDTMSLHTIVLAVGVADPSVFDAGPTGADGFRRPIAHLAHTLRERWETPSN